MSSITQQQSNISNKKPAEISLSFQKSSGQSGRPGNAAKKKDRNTSRGSFMAMWFNQYYRLLTAAVCALILIASYFLALGPKISNAMHIRNEEYKNVMDDQDKLNKQLNYLTSVQKDKRSVSIQDIQQIDSIIPSDEETPQILTSLEGIARQSGVIIEGIELIIFDKEKLSSMEHGAQIAPGGTSFVEVGVTISSSPYDAFKLFLENIENNMRLMDVIAVVYTPIGKSYHVALRAYYME